MGDHMKMMCWYKDVQKVWTTQPILVEYYVGLRLSVDLGIDTIITLWQVLAICLGESIFKQLMSGISVHIPNVHATILFIYGN